MSNLFEGGRGFFNIFKGGYLQKSLGNPDVDSIYLKWVINSILLISFFFVLYCSTVVKVYKNSV